MAAIQYSREIIAQAFEKTCRILKMWYL